MSNPKYPQLEKAFRECKVKLRNNMKWNRNRKYNRNEF